ncbi:MAG: BBE domain-containing protein [Plectolyngbya sp. WJT66-NPBG17]|nr:BBE domain-containing protein [Plectolyngbya sp. WJT66-NPBG17]
MLTRLLAIFSVKSQQVYWQRLKQVKQQYDPGSFFSFEQSIPVYSGDRGFA